MELGVPYERLEKNFIWTSNIQLVLGLLNNLLPTCEAIFASTVEERLVFLYIIWLVGVCQFFAGMR